MAAKKKPVKKTTKKPFMPPWMAPEEMPMGKGMPMGMNGDAVAAMKKPVISAKAMKKTTKKKVGKVKK
jgi:hypothetical protein